MEKELDPRRLEQIDRAMERIAEDFGVETDAIRARIIDQVPRFATRDQVARRITDVRAELKRTCAGDD
jgi:uncharacterized protein (DUF2267 family)